MTGEQLWEAIKIPLIDQVMTAYWEPYEKFIPSDQHMQSKAEACTVEGYNSVFRHFLTRVRWKTKDYSQSETML